MFGIGFSELLLVGLVSVVVLGPERLPGAVRVAGLWVGRLKRSFNEIKTEVEREIGVDEIRRQLASEHIQSMELEAEKQLAKKLLLLDEREALAVLPQALPAPAIATALSAPDPAAPSSTAAPNLHDLQAQREPHDR
jgi:sec-independent protein translocase protein TatB